MNKKLLTLAIGAALGAAPMFANAAATVYGEGHLSIDMVDDGQAINSSLMTLSSNSSFLGFKAEEDLGGGMKALAGLEWQIALDSANTNGSGTSCTAFPCSDTGIANRNVFVGLQGGFGTVRLGNYDDIVKNVGRKVDMFYSVQMGENRVLVSANSMDARLANSIRYDSPKLGPVTITAQYGLANNANESTGSNLTALAVGAQMNMGGLYVGAAYKSRDVDAGTTTDSTTGMRLTAAYTMGALKVAGLYQTFEDDVNGIDTSAMGVGASFKIGNGLIKGHYYIADESASGAENGATLMAFGYDHNLSKTTMVYAVYAMVDNDTNAAYSVLGGGGHANPSDSTGYNPVSNDSNGGLSFGMKVKF